MKVLTNRTINSFINKLSNKSLSPKEALSQIEIALSFINWLSSGDKISQNDSIRYRSELHKAKQHFITPQALSLPIPLKYVGFSLAVISLLLIGTGIYLRFYKNTKTPFAYSTAPLQAGRIISFQGRLTDTLGNPINAPIDITYNFYTQPTGGTAITGSTRVCTAGPDQDGVFNSLIGNDTGPSCNTEIPSSIFTENPNVYLGVTIGSEITEMSPRQQIANVGYAINSETLQGMPPGQNVSNVPFINKDGNLLIAAANPGLRSTYASANFTISSAQATTIQSAGSGDITLSASEGGSLRFKTYNGSLLERMTVLNTGRVGIGNTNPQALLDVGGNATLSGSLVAGGQIKLGEFGSAPTTYGNGSMYYDTTSNKVYFWNGTAWTDMGSGATQYFQRTLGSLAPTNITDDLNIGAIATGSAMVHLPGLTNKDAFFNLGTGKLGIGDTSPLSLFTVGNGDLFQIDSTGRIISVDGVAHTIDDVAGNLTLTSNSTTISLNDNVTFAGTTTLNGLAYTWPGSQNANYVLQSNGTGTLSWVDPGGAVASAVPWFEGAGILYPKNSTVDAFIGGQATNSAKFAFLNVNSGTPIASVSAGVAGAAFLTANGTLSTTARQTLTLGNSSTYNTTGNILLNPNGTGNVGIGTTGPTQKLEVAGNINIVAGNQLITDKIITGSTDLDIDSSINTRDILFTTGATEHMRIDTNNGNVGIGTTGPDAKLDSLATTEQLRLTYTDGTVYSAHTVDSSGNLTIDNTGTKTVIADDLSITGGDILNNTITFGDATGANNIVFSNPGIGNFSTLKFTKTNDNARIEVKEVTSDTTSFVFHMDDNPDGTGDKFYWENTSWTSPGHDWQPLLFSNLDATIKASDINMYGAVNVVGPYYSGTLGALSTIDMVKTGTLTITPDVSAFSGDTMPYCVTIDGVGSPNTFKWKSGVLGCSTDTSWAATAVPITGAAQTLNNGVTITFSGTTGGVLTDRYAFRANKGGTVTSPYLIGGTSTTSDLYLKTTTGVGTTGADIHFLTGNNGATEAMTILNSGNVGIGTTAPAAKLDVNGNLNVSTYATVSASLALGTSSAAAGPGNLNMSGNLTIAGPIKPGGAAGANGYLLTSSAGGVNTWTDPTTLGAGATLQTSYTGGNTIVTTTGRNIDFTLAAGLATPTSLTLTNNHVSNTTDFSLVNANASGTNTNGILVNQTGAGTLTNGINITRTAGVLTNGLTFTGTFGTNVINAPNFIVNNAGNITVTGGQGLDTITAGTLALGDTTANAINMGTSALARTIVVGNSTGTTSIALNTGTGSSLNLGTNAIAHTVTLGNIIGATAVNVNTGTAGTTYTTTNGIFTLNTGTGTISLGTDAAAKTITLGNATTTTALAFNSGTGDIILTSTDQVKLNSSKAAGGTVTEALSLKSTVDLGAADEVFQIGDSAADMVTVLGNGNVGVGTTGPATALDVNGVINAATGFRVANGATSTNYLRGNGTNFVSSAIQAADVPTLNQDTTGYADKLHYEDNRTISPSELSATLMKFGFTSYTNNNSAPWADFMHFRSYVDSSGGLDNLLVINRSGGFGMRLYQQTYGSATAYSTYKDIVLAENSPTANYVPKYSGTGTNVSITNSTIFDNGNVGIGTTGPDAKLDSLATTEQLRLTYTDGTVYSAHTVDSSGNLTINNTGTKTIIADDLQITDGDILDSNGNESIRFGTTASAVNEATLTNAATGGIVALAATGGDTDVAFSIDSKGADALNLNGTATGDILLGGGSGSTGCTVTNATGTLTCTVGISASSIPFSGITSGTNTIAAMVVGTGASLIYNGGTAFSGGINSNYLEGLRGITIAESLRANNVLTGGGTISVDASYNVNWTARFIVIANGRGTTFGTSGYYDITVPTAGTAITGVGGASSTTWSASGVTLPAWTSLYYILPIGSANSSLPANFRLVSYTSDVDVPANWILIAARNSDNQNIRFGNGIALLASQSYTTSSYSTAYAPNSAQLLGGTWAIPGTIGSTTPNTGAFTTLTASNTGAGALDVAGGVYAGTTNAFQIDVNGNISSSGTTGLTLSGAGANIAFAGTGPNQITTASGVNLALMPGGTGNVGIGTTAPGAKLEVAGQVKITGGTPGVNKVLTSDINGLATWETLGAASIADDSLDFIKFEDTLDLDANLVLNQAAYTWTQNFTGTTTTGLTYNANSLTSGTGASFSSTSTTLTTGGLLSLDWSPGSATAATGDLFSLNIGANGTIGNLFNVKDTGSSLFSVSETAVTSNLPTSFTSPGDVSVAYDLNFTNPTASYIKSAAPLYVQAGETFNSSDLTLKTYNSGDVVLDSPGGVTLAQAQAWTLPTSTTALNVQSGLMNFDTTNSRVGIGSTGPDARLDALSASGEQLRLTYTDGAAYTGFTVSSGGDLSIDATGGNVTLAGGDNLNLTTAGDIIFGGVTSLAETTSPTDSGAYIVGTNDEFTYSSSSTVQGVLKDLDTQIGSIIGGSSGLWTDGGTVTYLSATIDDLAIGGTTLAASMFGIDESAGNFYLGYDNSANPTLNFEATDGDAGEFGFNTNDSFYFSNANVGIGTTGPTSKLDVAGGSGVTTSIKTDGYVEDVSGIVQGNYVSSHSWANLGTGGVGIFNQNGVTSENSREWGIGPHGNRTILWKGGNDAGSDADGGWGTSAFSIDNTKTYRVSTWAKKSNSTDGTTYFGISGSNVTDLLGTAEGNPYFFCGDLPVLDRWYLLVGYIHGSGDSSTTANGGIYDGTNGRKVQSFGNTTNCNSEFKFTASATTQLHRAYLYYDTTLADRQYWWDPRFEEVNGKEPTIEALAGLYKGATQDAVSYFGGNVGIGTTAPNNRLQLSSDNSAQALQFNTSGYLSANQWGSRMYKLDIGGGIPLKIETQSAATWYGSVDMDHGQDNTHPSLKTYYNTQLAVTSGNVGIGTTGPGAKLDVANTSPATWTYAGLAGNYSLNLGRSDGSGVGSIKLNSYSSGQYAFIRPSNGNLHIDSTTGQYYFNWDSGVYGANAGVIHMANGSGTETVSLNSNGNSWFSGGNVGIGTTSPTAFLDLAASTTSQASLNLSSSAGTNPSTPISGDFWWNGTNLNFYNGASSTDILAGAIGGLSWTDGGTFVYPTGGKFIGNPTSGGANKIAGLYLADSAPLTFGNTNDVTFSYATNVLSTTLGSKAWNIASNLLYLKGSTNQIGIGTTNPLATLDIRALSSSTPVASISGVTNMASLVVDQSGLGDIFTASDSGQTRFVIKKNGNVGIGVANPTGLLSIAGSSSTISNSSGDITFDSASNNISFSNDNLISVGNIASIGQIQFGGFAGAPTAIGNGASYYDTLVNKIFYWDGGAWSEMGSKYWQRTLGSLASSNITDDLNIGAIATGSAMVHLPGLTNKNAFFNLGTGSLGVGTPTPNASYRLHVNGNILANAVYDASNPVFYINPAGDSNLGGNISMYGDIAVTDPTPLINSYDGAFYNTIMLRGAGDTTTASVCIDEGGTPGSCSGKLDAGTIDPPYTINGDRYATFLPAMTGVKEETTGKVLITEKNEAAHAYIKRIELGNQTVGSDLWLFSKVTNLKDQAKDLMVLLSSTTNGRIWYTVNPSDLVLTLYSTTPTEISYRLTAPRFDAYKWSNARGEGEHASGFIINDRGNIREGTTPTYTAPQLSYQNNVYSLIGNFIEEFTSANKALFGQITTGILNAQKIVSPIVETSEIKPIGKNLTVILGNEVTPESTSNGSQLSPDDKGKLSMLIIKGLNNKPVATIDAEGNATFSGNLTAQNVILGSAATPESDSGQARMTVYGNATVSGTLIAKNIQSENISDLENRMNVIANSVKQSQTQIASSSATPHNDTLAEQINAIQSELASLKNQPLPNPAYYQNIDAIYNNITVSDTANIYKAHISESLVVGSLFIEPTSILALSSDLRISSLGTIRLFDDAVVIAKNGNMAIKGGVSATSLAIKNKEGITVASIDASGSARFNEVIAKKFTLEQIATQGALIADSGIMDLENIPIPAIKTNAEIAGTGTLPQDIKEIIIYNDNVTANSLIYLTPTTNNIQGQLSVTKKITCPVNGFDLPAGRQVNQTPTACSPYFVVSSNNAIHSASAFNWLIIN